MSHVGIGIGINSRHSVSCHVKSQVRMAFCAWPRPDNTTRREIAEILTGCAKQHSIQCHIYLHVIHSNIKFILSEIIGSCFWCVF